MVFAATFARRSPVPFPLVAGKGPHHRRRRLHRLAPRRAAARRGLGGLGARRPLDGVARQRRAPERPPGVPSRRRVRPLANGRQRAREQVRRRLPPRRGGRRPPDRRAAGAHDRDEPRGLRDRARPLHEASGSACCGVESEVYGDHRDERAADENARRVYGPTTQRRWLYADSKAMDEFLALAYRQERDLDFVIARLLQHGRPRQQGQYGMVVARFVGRRSPASRSSSTATARRRARSATSHDTIRALDGADGGAPHSGEIYNVGSPSSSRSSTSRSACWS